MKSSHQISDLLNLTHATPMLIISIFLLTILIVKRFFSKQLDQWGYNISKSLKHEVS